VKIELDTRASGSRRAVFVLVAGALIVAATGAAQDEPQASPSDPKPADTQTWKTLAPGDYLGHNQRAKILQRGKAVYEKYCVGCHGEAGDGAGPAAKRLITKPRDFTKGIYKFRSTDSSSLPLDADIHRTLRRGLSRVSMPSFRMVPDSEILAVTEYIKNFYVDWDEDEPDRQVVHVPAAPGDLATADRIERGRVVYVVMQCYTCHGIDGAGTGATETEFTDAWGNIQKPYNFTRGGLKSGDDPEDIFRTFSAGLISVMPSYPGVILASTSQATFATNAAVLPAGEHDRLQTALAAFPATGADFAALSVADKAELAERNSWDLVAFVMSLREPGTTAGAVLGRDW